MLRCRRNSPKAAVLGSARKRAFKGVAYGMARLEFYGAVFIVALGSLLHFTYKAADQAWWVGIFSAMDESVWEHLKLAFWPGAIWTLSLRLTPISRPKNFWAGRAASLLLMPLAIALGFYGYTAVLGSHSLILDLALFVASVACGQAAAVGVYSGSPLGRGFEAAALMLVLFTLAAFSTLSFIKPDIPLFHPSEHAG
jgi:hypothetical protein